jgi:hypothetical protein
VVRLAIIGLAGPFEFDRLKRRIARMEATMDRKERNYDIIEHIKSELHVICALADQVKQDNGEVIFSESKCITETTLENTAARIIKSAKLITLYLRDLEP